MRLYFEKYFPELDDNQIALLLKYHDLLLEWNQKINLISRKDTDNIILHHLIHSLALKKIFSLKPGMKVADIGTGGGLPGIPLSIVFPESYFTLIDSIGKKIEALKDITSRLGITNISLLHARAEKITMKFDVIIGRAVAPVESFAATVGHLLTSQGKIFYWTGYSEQKARIKIHHLSDMFEEEYFTGKTIMEADKTLF
ncbi:MAG: 16S rRNA (guanine(527)-N(7))-methyltransferase RsmG [Sphingobacteriales bacterium]|nr:16S rRNA (guanine(527)-N(7))-methyltransferase RsmG [Sphingobacteriales bacterium]